MNNVQNPTISTGHAHAKPPISSKYHQLFDVKLNYYRIVFFSLRFVQMSSFQSALCDEICSFYFGELRINKAKENIIWMFDEQNWLV